MLQQHPPQANSEMKDSWKFSTKQHFLPMKQHFFAKEKREEKPHPFEFHKYKRIFVFIYSFHGQGTRKASLPHQV